MPGGGGSENPQGDKGEECFTAAKNTMVGPAARFFSLERAQKELRTLMVERYLEFDRQAWWWPSQIHVEAKILEIASQEELNRLDQISKQYSDNLKARTAAIDSLWNCGTLFFARNTIRQIPKMKSC
jgi:hypothetical protein